MDKQRYLVEKLEDYNDVFEVSDGEFLRCISSKKSNIKSFAGEYAKGDLDKRSSDLIAELSSEDNLELVLPISAYKSHNRLLYAEKGYVKCKDRDDYVVLLKNVLFARFLWLLGLIAIFIIAFFSTSYLLGQKNSPRLGSGTDLLSEDTVGILVPVYKEINAQANKTNANIEIENAMENTYYCQIYIDLITSGGSERIYSSAMLPPSTLLTDITLAKPLSAGTYEVKITHIYHVKTSDTEFQSLHPASVITKLVVT